MEVSRLPISASHIGKLISAGYTSIYSISSLSPSDIARVGPVGGIGANWGTHATHPLELFDSTTLTALSGSGMEIMVGIPNEMLYSLANSVAAAEKWVEKNVSAHISSNSVNTRETNCFPS